MPVGIETHHATDVVTRVCSCKKCSRFLLCKHLVKRKELTGPVAADFFRNVRRVRAPPFWVLPGHVDFPVLQINTQPAIEPEGQSIDDELLEVEDVDSDPENDIKPSPEELFDYLEAT